jgi:TolA-binding protein
LKVKFKALQKYCREMNDKTVKLEDELSQLRVEVVQRREDVEREEFKSQQLLKRVEALQAKQAERESVAQGEKKGFWGMFKGGEGAMKDEYEKLEKMY